MTAIRRMADIGYHSYVGRKSASLRHAGTSALRQLIWRKCGSRSRSCHSIQSFNLHNKSRLLEAVTGRIRIKTTLFISSVLLSIYLMILQSAYADDRTTPKSIDEYFIGNKLITSQKSFINSENTQRIEYYCEDENLPGGANEGASNPANVHCAAALFVKQSGKWMFSDRLELRYGTVKKFTGNKLEIDLLEYGDHDSLCCPTDHTLLTYSTRSGKISEDISAEGKLPIVKAVEENANANHVANMITRGANVNSRDTKGKPILIIAVEKQNIDVVQLLLEHGANINASQRNGNTALISAAMGGLRNTDIVRLLLEKGADPNASQEDGTTALIYAAIGGSAEQVNLLLDKGANVNARKDDGWSALDFAISQSRREVAQLLLKRGAKTDEVSNKVVPLVLAASGFDVGMVKLLLDNGANINAKDSKGNTALRNASGGNERIEIVKLLLERGADINATNNDGRTALLEAIELGNKSVVRLLLGKGADPNVMDSYGATELRTFHGYDPESRTIDFIQLLLDHGADINAKSPNGETALMHAAMNGQVGPVRLMINRGAAINEKDKKGYTAIFHNAYGISFNCKVIRVLLEKGAKTKDNEPSSSYLIRRVTEKKNDPDCAQSLILMK